jgi:hypothetical protein
VAEEQSNPIDDLSKSIEDLSNAMDGVRNALRDCRSAGMNDTHIRDAIADNLPEEDRHAFLAQWPMLSMMFAALQ